MTNEHVVPISAGNIYDKAPAPHLHQGGNGLRARILPALQDFDLAVLDREAHVAREQIIQARAQKLEAPAVAKAAPLGMIDVLGKIVARCDHGRRHARLIRNQADEGVHEVRDALQIA